MSLIYRFDAKGIQRFILDGGKLRDIIGGSEMVDRLCRPEGADVLEGVLAASGLHACNPQFSRRAGGAFVLHLEGQGEEAEFILFRRLWSLVVGQYAPGLEYVDAVSRATTLRDALKKIRPNGNTPNALLEIEGDSRRNDAATLLPIAGPMVHRSPRTGRPAIARDRSEGLDAGTYRRRQPRFVRSRDLTDRLLPSDELDKWRWPLDLDFSGSDSEVMFPFVDEDTTIGLLHADGNGVGAALKALDEFAKQFADNIYIDLFKDFSKAIGDATVAAAQEAAREILVPVAKKHRKVVPARPIVLGGDDLTLILRADIAIPFARCFLAGFRRATNAEFGRIFWREKHRAPFAEFVAKNPDSARPLAEMTACAGLVLVKASAPYQLTYRLVEDLCDVAKAKARGTAQTPVQSTLAYCRITSSLIASSLDEMRAGEFVAGDLVLTRQPYGADAGPDGEKSELDTLDALRELLRQLPVGLGPLRHLRTLLVVDRPAAVRSYERWRRNLEAADLTRNKSQQLDDLLRSLVGPLRDDLPFGKDRSETPLFDALDWPSLA